LKGIRTVKTENALAIITINTESNIGISNILKWKLILAINIPIDKKINEFATKPRYP